MKTTSLGFIGGGRITKIILQAFANKKVEFHSVIVYDTNADTLTALKQQFPSIVVAENLKQVAQQPTVFIALHPPVIMETLDKITDTITEDTRVISLAPKITIEKIASKLKTKNIARMIPNATSYINEGYNPVSYHPEMGWSEKKQIKKLIKKLGKAFKTEESKLEGYALISAMLPTYFVFQWMVLQDVAMKTGLSVDEAEEAIYTTLKRAIKLYFISGLTPDEVLNLIPVKPIGEYENEISDIYQKKLMGLFDKIKP